MLKGKPHSFRNNFLKFYLYTNFLWHYFEKHVNIIVVTQKHFIFLSEKKSKLSKKYIFKYQVYIQDWDFVLE